MLNFQMFLIMLKNHLIDMQNFVASIALLDLCMAMIPYTDVAGLKRVFDLSLPRLQVSIFQLRSRSDICIFADICLI